MAPRLAPDGTSLTLMGMPLEIRRAILQEILDADMNTTTAILLAAVDPSVWIFADDRAFKFAAHRLGVRCHLLGAAVVQTCRELYFSATQVLLDDNYLVAIIGKTRRVRKILEAMNMNTFWVQQGWAGKWGGEDRCFDLFGRTFRPELTIRFEDSDAASEVILIPARHLSHVALAVGGARLWDQPFRCVSETHVGLPGLPPVLRSFTLLNEERHDETQVELTFKGRCGKLWVAQGQELTLKYLRDKLFLWVTRNLRSIAFVSEATTTAKEEAMAAQIGRSLQHELFSVNLRQSLNYLDEMDFDRQLCGMSRRVERLVLAGKQVKAMETFQDLANRYVAYRRIRLAEPETNESWAAFWKIQLCFGVASYRISSLTDASAIGWKEDDLRQWTLQRAGHALCEFFNHHDGDIATIAQGDEEFDWGDRIRLMMMKLAVDRRTLRDGDVLYHLEVLAWLVRPAHLSPVDGEHWCFPFIEERIGSTRTEVPGPTGSRFTETTYQRIAELLHQVEQTILAKIGPTPTLGSTPWGNPDAMPWYKLSPTLPDDTGAFEERSDDWYDYE